ncbi:MAG TPA: lysophospholipid acyltransferase family protein [Micromonosporaceae bacterium]|nr:lysophospholipid acyltransferase family protein [Micromonosporaceae bacterium]
MSQPVAAWRPPLLWRALLVVARVVVAALCRMRVTGDVPAHLRRGPLVLAVNHVSPFDPVVLAAACQARRVAPRIMATGGLFTAPMVGVLMRMCGHIRVDRGRATVTQALHTAAAAVAEGSVVAGYPEGRIGLDPGLWPERGKTGLARLALASGATVVPVALWGPHEVLPYATPKGLVGSVLRALRRRPVVRVAFGVPVDLAGLSAGRTGDALRATDRILDAIVATLRPLRRDEPHTPRYVDPTRPTSTARSRPPPG